MIEVLLASPARGSSRSRLRSGSLLILDEAHHAAPSSGGRYGIESKFNRAVRDLAGRFERRHVDPYERSGMALAGRALSAYPNNGTILAQIVTPRSRRQLYHCGCKLLGSRMGSVAG